MGSSTLSPFDLESFVIADAKAPKALKGAKGVKNRLRAAHAAGKKQLTFTFATACINELQEIFKYASAKGWRSKIIRKTVRARRPTWRSRTSHPHYTAKNNNGKLRLENMEYYSGDMDADVFGDCLAEDNVKHLQEGNLITREEDETIQPTLSEVLGDKYPNVHVVLYVKVRMFFRDKKRPKIKLKRRVFAR